MAVIITDECINCDTCVEECPAMAIVSVDDSPLDEPEFTYVKPEKCIECVDCSVSKCFDVCPTPGAIAWDMPYTQEYDDYYMERNGEGIYNIRVHKSKGIFSPANQPKPYRESISIEDRVEHKALEF
ncbi:4Fe-4S ferredoxin [Halarcobacter ebronensis]|uniref:4Fe-4S ferredoxin n=1 Tax=Halarcobacter ebronensis TaxID=1462615 RepID=A0A4Q0YI82_9BACT|nr:4Fe-4S dicluster domain-containing protein [Halarcobacter ebronensis]RXJ68561.1 4Fe-4S ferredoxin [Halarcobacter ebronensis]